MLVRLIAFTGKLKDLTESGAIKWQGSDMICYQAHCKGFKISAWWYQDDKPSLLVNDASLVGYGYGIENLLGAIRDQQREPKIDEEFERHEKAKKRAEQENTEHLNRVVSDFLRKHPK